MRGNFHTAQDFQLHLVGLGGIETANVRREHARVGRGNGIYIDRRPAGALVE